MARICVINIQGEEISGLFSHYAKDISRGCVAEGAEAIILGCTGLGPIFTIEGVTSIPDLEVPIFDCLAVAIKAAESVVDFKERLDFPFTSRACMYKPPREKDLMMARENFGIKPH